MVVLGLMFFIDALFVKWDVWEMISKLGSSTKSLFVYKMTQCRFCLMFHFSIIITIVYGIFSSFSFDLTIIPFVVGGFIYNQRKNGL